eukprot:TRINITY_DN79032_c0_g1_i1.p1 TRINITY_DN79032_c0_g1~~TRINITY_DN79032_c0_g1_i1.p1  ORF type:complete len:143 (+),score=21.13 TRINITY_DN79032_c0_g1_i1:104-532(+)
MNPDFNPVFSLTVTLPGTATTQANHNIWLGFCDQQTNFPDPSDLASVSTAWMVSTEGYTRNNGVSAFVGGGVGCWQGGGTSCKLTVGLDVSSQSLWAQWGDGVIINNLFADVCGSTSHANCNPCVTILGEKGASFWVSPGTQ